MPYGNKKKMGCSGGGPNMYKVGSKEIDSPMNFSDKAMMYMKKMPAMYGKPKMTNGDPPEKKIITDYPSGKPVTNKKIDPSTPITDRPRVKTKPKTKPDAFDKKLENFMNRNIESGDLDKLFKSAPNTPPKGARIKEMPGVYPMMTYGKKKK